MNHTSPILLVVVLVLGASSAQVFAAKSKCLLDGTMESADRAAIGAARQAIHRACACEEFDGSARGKRRGDYRKCVREALVSQATSGSLRAACVKQVRRDFSRSACGRPAERNLVPCLRRKAATDDLRCSIRRTESCVTTTRYPETVPCSTAALCAEAGDTNEDGRVDRTDTGACVERPRWIRDAQGRALILHGINVSNDAKREPLRVGWTTQADIQRLSQDWGFNVTRLLVFWDAIEPEKGVFDEAYLDRVAERIGWAADAGLFVILDMHQDIYSSVFNGDGAPAWAVRDDGLPFTLQSPWWLNYIQPAVTRAFENFWDHDGLHADLQEHYTLAWLRVVERFADEENVLGYDLMNEPFQSAEKLYTFEAEDLLPFYERMLVEIRKLDPDGWIFLEPSAVLVNIGLASELPTVLDARLGAPRLAYAPHLYVPSIHEGGPYTNPAVLETWINQRIPEMARNPGPALIGEFGVSSSVTGHVQFLKDIFAMADEHLSGWIYWSYDPGSWGPIDGSGNEQEKIAALVRTYAQRIAGDPISHSFDPTTREFEVRFAERAGTTGPTEIYVPAQRFYAGGWVVETSDPAENITTQWDPAREILSVTSDPSQAEHRITIRPAP